MKPITCASVVPCVIALLTLAAGPLVTAATWQGGDGDWVSDNWGLDGPDGSPGDANYGGETALGTASGEIRINPGDEINHDAVAFFSVNTVVQTGGSYIEDTRLDIRTRYDLEDGVLTGSGSFRVNGGTLNVDGGMFGTRVTAPTGFAKPDSVLSFQGSGTSTLVVTEDGIVDIHTLSMEDQTAGGDAVVEVHGVIASGDPFDRSTLFWQLKKASVAASATARFIFSDQGITPWTLISNNSLDLGTGADRGDLEANVTELTSDGTVGHTLIDYRLNIMGDGTFGEITITDDVLGTLSEGTLGSLQQGEYFLDYTGGDDSDDIVLYYNNIIPEPGSLMLLGAGGAMVFLRRRD